MYSAYLDQQLDQYVHIIGDPQFGSPEVFKHVASRRSFGSIENFHRALVDNWNAAIGQDDTVLCLGDFTQNKKHADHTLELIERYSRQLNGNKILIRGNHDLGETQYYYDYGWRAVIEFPLVMLDGKTRWLNVPSRTAGCIIKDIGGHRILFSHFAIFEDECDDRRYLVDKAYLRELFSTYRCDINIHGHTHERPVTARQCYSACVEQTRFCPIMLNDFLTIHGLGRYTESA